MSSGAVDVIVEYERLLGPAKKCGSQYYFPCFRCDTGYSRHLAVSPSNGLYYCFKCGSNPDGLGKGSITKLARHLGSSVNVSLSYSEEDPVSYYIQDVVIEFILSNAVLSDYHKGYLAARGIDYKRFNLLSTDGLFEKLANRFAETQLVSAGLAKPGMRPSKCMEDCRIIIPYPDQMYLRTRSTRWNEKIVYAGPNGVSAKDHYWGRVHPKYVMITEGEFKAMAAVSAGVNTIALPGMNTSHLKVSTTLKESNTRIVYLCFDTQEDMTGVDHAVDSLVKAIRRQFLPVIYRVRLPLIPSIDHGQKMDIDSFIGKFGGEAFKKYIISSKVEV